MRGRKPYPYTMMEETNDKQHLTKDELKKRRENEPRIQSNELKCPEHLCEEAKAEWDRITELYKEFSNPILCDLDSNTLEVYCNAVVTYRRATRKVRETAEVYVRKGDPTPRKNPWQRVADTAADQIKKYGELLLLNPVSRARAGLAREKKDEELSPAERYFKERFKNV